MRNGDNFDSVSSDKINDLERENTKNVPPCTMLVAWPGIRTLHDARNSLLELIEKRRGRGGAAFEIPIKSCAEFIDRSRMKSDLSQQI
jgi:hypothetical protein